MNEIGRKTLVGIGKESTFGTKASTITYFPVENFDPAPRVEKVREQGIFGRKEGTLGGVCIGKKFAEPSFDGLVYDEVIGQLIMGALGTDTTTGASTPYSHTFTSDNDAIPSYTIVWKDGNMTKMLTGCVLSSLELNQDVGDFLKYSTSFVSKYPATTTETPSITAENRFCSKFATVKIATNVAGLSGASAVNAESFRLTIEKNAEAKYVFGNTEPNAIYDKQLDVNGEFTVSMDSGTYLDLFENGTTQALQFETINTDITLGAGNPELSVVLDAVDISEWSRSGGKDDRVMQTCGYMGAYDLATSKEIEVVLKNDQSTSY